jgi:hypothetical protein
MTEKQLTRIVADAATTFGWRRYHTHRSDFSPAGYPDETLLRGHQLIFAELKSDTGKLSPLQTEWLDDLGRNQPGRVTDVRAYLWRPDDIETIIRVLR